MLRHQDTSGFTLLEIMLAMLILGMVLSMISLSLSGSINAINATMDQGEIYYRAQVAMERINDDLTSALLHEHVEFIGSGDGSAGGESILLTFASLAHIIFDPQNGQRGTGIISYAVRPDQQNDRYLQLLRSDVLYRPQDENTKNEPEEAFLLCDRLRSVEFSFIDRNGEKLESWDTTIREGEEEAERRLPVAVSCRLEFWADEEEERTLSFQTTVILPAGLIQPEPEENTDAV